MDLKKIDIQKLIDDLKGLEGIMNHAVSKPVAHKPTPADNYDVRYIGKIEAKKLTRPELESLIKYSEEYLQNYFDKNYLYRFPKRGMRIADFDEAEAYQQIKASLTVMNDALKTRM